MSTNNTAYVVLVLVSPAVVIPVFLVQTTYPPTSEFDQDDFPPDYIKSFVPLVLVSI